MWFKSNYVFLDDYKAKKRALYCKNIRFSLIILRKIELSILGKSKKIHKKKGANESF